MSKITLTKSIFSDDSVGAGNFLHRLYKKVAEENVQLITSVNAQGESTQYSLKDLVSISDRLSSVYWSLGVRPESVVALYLDDGISYYLHYLALTRIGAIPAFVNGGLSAELTVKYLDYVKPFLLVSTATRINSIYKNIQNLDNTDYTISDVDDIEHVEIKDCHEIYVHRNNSLVLITHTSGTTGLPKAVIFNHHGLIYAVKQQLSSSLGDVILSAVPHSHAAGIVTLMNSVLRLSHLIVVTDKSTSGLVCSIHKYKPSLVFAFAKVYLDLCREKINAVALDSVSIWASTADASHEPHIRKMVKFGHYYKNGQKKKGSIFVDNLGSSETAFGIFRNIHTQKTSKYGRCIGKNFSWAEVRLFDDNDDVIKEYGVVGRLGIKSPSITVGYWNNQNETQKAQLNGYWLTGDLVYQDHNGSFYHMDRAVDAIVINDEKYYSCQIEEKVLANIPQVFDCTIVQDELGHGVILEVETRERAEWNHVLKIIQSFFKSNELPPLSKCYKVAPGWNEGVTGKKLKRVIRAFNLEGTENA